MTIATDFSLWAGLSGGLLIGLSAALLILLNGNIAGISGIVGGLLKKWDRSAPWRVCFLVGMVGGGVLYTAWQGTPLDVRLSTPTALTITAGLLVGFGARLGSGCTSGHGVCGLARLSPRSVVATLTFMLMAMLTVLVMRHVLPA
jgi:uncharacterized protein